MNQPGKDPAVPLIRMTEVEKKYGNQRVLHINAFDLHERDVVAITGENGAGKSTLLRLLAGISQPTSGTVRYAPRYADLNIAYVPQAGGLHRHLTILENLNLSCQMQGQTVEASILESGYFKMLGLSGQVHKPFDALSGGFQKLAAISCALATEPDGLFLDEPFSGLDDEKAALLFEHLVDLNRLRGFVVITTHLVAQPQLVTRAIGLSGGRMI